MNRSRMRRQLYSGGGITSVPRVNFGLGSEWQEFKDKVIGRTRKLIPNELADVASKAAPFVAPFYPGIAGLMRGIGRLDKRGSLSDALKQGLLTYGFGKGVGKLGGASGSEMGNVFGRQTYTPEGFQERGLGRLFSRGETQAADTSVKSKNVLSDVELAEEGFRNIPTVPTSGDPYSLKGIWDKFQSLPAEARTAIVGVGSGAIAGIAQWFENQIPQEPGETTEEYLARRKVAVGKLMREYMDNTRAYDAEWTSMTDQQKDETVANFNYNQGGRVGYQTGGISMANTLAQNIAANQAQAAQVNKIIQQARTKLPGASGAQTTSAPQTTSGMTTIPTQQAAGAAAPTVQTAGVAAPVTQTTSGVPSNFVGFSTPGAPPPLGSFQDPLLARYGIKQADYSKMTPDEQDKLWRKIDYADKYGGELATTYNILQERGIDPSKYRTTSSSGYPEYDRLGIMEAMLRSDVDELYGEWPGHGKTITGQETFDELLGLDDYWKQFRYNQGGRVGLYGGGEAEDRLQTDASDITYEGNMRMASDILGDESGDIANELWGRMSNEERREWGSIENYMKSDDFQTILINLQTKRQAPQGIQMAAQGGRIGYRFGHGPAGIPGIPRMAPDGMEYDMSQNGGFQPLGAKEGKDDVKANLAKNEFVFTADAVRGAGGGDIELGAQRMYDTMKNLEKRMA